MFAYPENQLSPNLYVAADSPVLKTSAAYVTFLSNLRGVAKATPDVLHGMLHTYGDSLAAEKDEAGNPIILPSGYEFFVTERLTDAQLLSRQTNFPPGTDSNPSDIVFYLREAYWLMPMLIGLRLQADREYVAALDWFRTVYAFHLSVDYTKSPPVDNRKIFRGLALEASITTWYTRLPDWIASELNPHLIVRVTTSGTTLVGRKNAYLRFTVLSIVQCLLAYADQQFSSGSAESTAQARTLYESAVNLLNLPELRSEEHTSQ